MYTNTDINYSHIVIHHWQSKGLTMSVKDYAKIIYRGAWAVCTIETVCYKFGKPFQLLSDVATFLESRNLKEEELSTFLEHVWVHGLQMPEDWASYSIQELVNLKSGG